MAMETEIRRRTHRGELNGVDGSARGFSMATQSDGEDLRRANIGVPGKQRGASE